MSNLLRLDTVKDIKEVIAVEAVVLVEFGADWCIPCKRFEPHFERFANLHSAVACVKVDIGVDPAVQSEYKIKSVPQVMLFVNGQYSKHVDGRTVLQLENELSEHFS